MAFDNNITWFQEKIGKYDKATWERVFEEQQQEKGFNYVPKKAGGLKPELIDVDLVNGSTFSKAKPMHGWLTVAREGVLRVILYPFFHEWWRNQTSTKLWLLFLLLYISEIFSMAIYYTDYYGEIQVVAWTEACGPAVVMVFLGILHTHVVSTDSFKGMKTRKGAKVARKRHLNHQKKNSFDNGHRGEMSNGEVQNISARDSCRSDLRHRKRIVSDTDEDKYSVEDYETENNDKTEEEVSDSGDSTGSTTESDNSDMEMDSANYDEDPFAWDVQDNNKGTGASVAPSISEKVMVSVWEGRQCQKAQLSILEISAAIVRKVDSHKWNMGYLHFGSVVSAILSLVPLIFRMYTTGETLDWNTVAGLQQALRVMFGFSWRSRAIVVIGMFARLVLSFAFFFLLCVAERSYRQRCLYAKLFGWLTSSRKARRAALPHFRLHKVRNIKTWLSLRSLLKRRGPQRSVDMIVSTSFLLSILLVIVMCVQLLKGNEERFLSQLFNWEISIWCLVSCIFVLRFITLGAKINRKYRNTSVLLTEQINLYLQMERSPHKKDELIISNNVLKLATKLLKEIESPFKLYGLSMSPLLYNITRVVVLSLFSGVMSDLLGFRLKLWKIKP